MMFMFRSVIGSLLLFSLCWGQNLLAATVVEQHQYQRTFGAETSIMNWQHLGGKPEWVITEINGEIDQTEMGQDLSTKAWQVNDEKQRTDFSIKRILNRLHISGVFKGKPIDRWETIDTAPWFQTMSISFRPFLHSCQDSIEFWIVRPDNLSVHKLKAVKNGAEQLTIGGEAVSADNIELRLAGLGSLFWKANYWFRKQDGLFLRYVGPGGFPDKPKVMVEISDY